MTIDEYIQESYDALANLGILEKVLINTSTFPLHLSSCVTTDVVGCLFEWQHTPEGRDYWRDIYRKLPNRLKNGCNITRRDAYHRLLALHESQQSQPYEYW